LPIGSRRVRCDELRPPLQVARLELEFIRLPVFSVAASFNDDFGSFRGHDSKQSVAVDRTKGRNPFVQERRWLRPSELITEHAAKLKQGHYHHNDTKRSCEPCRPTNSPHRLRVRERFAHCSVRA